VVKKTRERFFDKNCNVCRRIIGVDTREIRATIFPVKVQIWSLRCCAVWNQYYRNRIILAGVKIHDKYRLFYFFSSVDLCFCCCYLIHARKFWFDIYVSCVKTALILVGYTEWIGESELELNKITQVFIRKLINKNAFLPIWSIFFCSDLCNSCFVGYFGSTKKRN